ncbi:MAG TPA: hypothetical protein VMG12_03790 [Polyangiaceae bacterium]|nr:hypothetical protein [Polyangiaceae bacterium]
MTQPATKPPDPLSSPESGALSVDPDTRVRANDALLAPRFVAQLAHASDGIGMVHVLECWQRRGVLSRFARAGSGGLELGTLAAQSHANLGYLAVVVRVLAAQGWMWRTFQPAKQTVEQTRAGLTPAGAQLVELVSTGAAAAQVVAFTPVARRMAAYLDGRYDAEPGLPSLEQLSQWSSRGWGLPADDGADGDTSRRWKAALTGNLLGPVASALALSPPFAWARGDGTREPERRSYVGPCEPRRVEPATLRELAALDVLAHAGWASWRDGVAEITPFGSYALRRALAYGVPVSYLPLFENIEALLFGDAGRFWQRAPGAPERHIDRALNVRASGASHTRYFAAADELIVRAFDRPWPDQPLGFCDMGSGDGSWLEHVYELITTRTERGRLMRAYPHDSRYRLVLVGADYNEAARAATHERLSRAGIGHLVTFGDINDPAALREDLARRGIDCQQLLHGNSFLVHNRPYVGVKSVTSAARRRAGDGAYAWRGRAIPNAELQQNLVEFFTGWREVIGQHGMIVIELHDPEQVTVGKTLTSYMLTHGLSDQFTVGLGAFLRAAAEAQLEVDHERQRLFPDSRSAAAISVSHLRVRV